MKHFTFYREIEEFYHKIGYSSSRASALNNIGGVMAGQGDINAARSAYDQALEAATSARAKSSQRTALQRKGDLRVWQGIFVARRSFIKTPPWRSRATPTKRLKRLTCLIVSCHFYS